MSTKNTIEDLSSNTEHWYYDSSDDAFHLEFDKKCMVEEDDDDGFHVTVTKESPLYARLEKHTFKNE